MRRHLTVADRARADGALPARARPRRPQVAEAYLARIERARRRRCGAYLTVTREQALRRGRASRTRAIAPARRAGRSTACRSRSRTCSARAASAPPAARGSSSASCRRTTRRWSRGCDAAGAVLLGKTNMDEFAMGSSTENSAFGTTRNPWDLARVPGGSSGGSAAAVAADLAARRLGTDTGGSIRQPAAFCGVVGLKPTYGRVSRYGVVAFASSLDQVGPFAQDVRGRGARCSGRSPAHDPRDSTSVDAPVPDYAAALGAGVDGLRLGRPARVLHRRAWIPRSSARCARPSTCSRSSAPRIEPVSLPHTEYGLAAYYVIAPAEASSNLARYDGVQYGLRAPGARDLIDMYERDPRGRLRRRGQAPHHARHLRALGRLLRRLLRQGAEGAHADAPRLRARPSSACDVIVAPTTPERRVQASARRKTRSQMYLNDIFTIPANLAGLPGVSCRAASPRPACRSACSSSAAPSTRRPCCAPPTPTSRRPTWHDAPPGARAMSDDHRATRRSSASRCTRSSHRVQDVLRLLGHLRRGAEHADLSGLPGHAGRRCR